MSDAPSRGVMIVLAYLWPLALVPLLLEKTDLEVRWHAKQGLALMGAEVILAGIFLAVGVAASLAALWLGSLLIVVAIIVWFVVFAVHAVGAIKGLGGSRLRLPLVSRFADRL